MINFYKGFRVGDIVTVNEVTECQYFDYPHKGDNNKTLKSGEKAVIDTIPSKVRINIPGTGEYFFNLIRLNSMDTTIYPVLDYHKLVKIDS